MICKRNPVERTFQRTQQNLSLLQDVQKTRNCWRASDHWTTTSYVCCSSLLWVEYRWLSSKCQAECQESVSVVAENPFHSSLHLSASTQEGIWSVRVTRDYRALGVLEGDTVLDRKSQTIMAFFVSWSAPTLRWSGQLRDKRALLIWLKQWRLGNSASTKYARLFESNSVSMFFRYSAGLAVIQH